MAHFAQLNGNIVEQVIVVSNDVINNLDFPDSEPLGVAFCRSLFGEDTEWKQTSYNANFRYHYASFGFTWDETAQAFIPPQPFPSWVLNTTKYVWEAPVPYPIGENKYTWDENSQTWIEIPN
jgi:hypothetical protein